MGVPKYSAIAHHAMHTWSTVNWPDVRFLMLSFYDDSGFTAGFDASGKEADQPVVIVAGFVSSAKDWISFSEQWQARLALDGFSYFHMVEFAHSAEHFAKLKGNEGKRRELLGDLMEIIKSHAYRKFALAVEVPVFVQGLDEEFRKQFYLTAYSLLGRVVAAEAYSWHRELKLSAPLKLVFETGDDQEELSKRMQGDGYPAPDFRPKTDRTSKLGIFESGYLPLQAADFLAYEYFLKMKRTVEGLDDSRVWAWSEFARIIGEPGVFTEQSLIGAQELFSAIRVAQESVRTISRAAESGQKERDET